MLVAFKLTPVQKRVSAPEMTDNYSNNSAAPSAQQTLADELLRPLLARRRPERILLLKHSASRDLQLEIDYPTQLVRLDSTAGADHAPVKCRLDALPFEESVFDLVVLHHLVDDGTEPLLDEAIRVLVDGGDVVISGLNSSGPEAG